LVFRLPAVGEVGDEILFRLRVLNSVGILVLAVEIKGPPCCNGCVGRVATRVLLGFLVYCVVGFVLPHFV
jgi:hypothetical protein